MGWTSFIQDIVTGVSIGITIDNRGNVIFGGGNDQVDGYGNVVFGNGDSHVSGAGNVVFGTNTVSGFGNVLFGNNNDINGNGNVLFEAHGNNVNGNGNVLFSSDNSTIDGNGNIVGGQNSLLLNGDDQTYIEGDSWQDTIDFHSDLAPHTLPSISFHNPSSSGSKDGSIILTSDLGYNHTEGTNGNDILVGGDEGNTINGGSGNDIITGGKGTDVLNGGSGNDIMVGEDGNDLLTGGKGEDLFGFSPGDGHDQITDFEIADDTLHLSGKNQLSSLSEVLAAASEATSAANGEGGVLIAIPEGGSLFLEGLTLTELASVTMQFE